MRGRYMVLASAALVMWSVACDVYDPEPLQRASSPMTPAPVREMDGAMPAAGGSTPLPPLGGQGGSGSGAPAPVFDAAMRDARVDIVDGGAILPDAAPMPDAAPVPDAGVDSGCGVVDGDSDGTPDCRDGCPADPNKTDPGMCGCGWRDQDGAGVAGCLGLRNALVHRYRFDGTGATAADSVGSSTGAIINAQLAGTGTLTLAGASSDQYVDLPNQVVSTLQDATFEAWLTWNGGAAWQRIFDFGDTTAAAEGSQGSGNSYLFLTPASVSNTLRAAFKLAGVSTTAEVRVETSSPLATSVLSHVAVVADDTNNLLLLYVDGAQADSAAWTDTLSTIDDVNNWLGRSQFSTDPELGGVLHEFRIYSAALTAPQIQTSFSAGPDPAFLQP